MIKLLCSAFIALFTALTSVKQYLSNGTQTQLISNIGQTTSANPNFTEIYKAWVTWEENYSKIYGQQGPPLKFLNFVNNYRYVVETNAKNLSYKLGLNDFSDMTNEEFSALLQGNIILNEKIKRNYVKLSTVKIPESVNWLYEGAVTSVKNQGQCGAGWAFSTTGGLEGFNFLKSGNLISFSEQQLIDCSTTYQNEGCNGGLTDWAYQYTAAEGIAEESVYPYLGIDQTCQYNKSNVNFKNNGYADVTPNSPSQLQAAVAQQPISILIEADQPVFKNYASGVLDDTGCFSEGQINHAALVVGYDKQNGNNYWIVKNSWGTGWGQNGYVWIYFDPSTNDSGICGLNTAPSYPN